MKIKATNHLYHALASRIFSRAGSDVVLSRLMILSGGNLRGTMMVMAGACLAMPASAIEITGYSSTVNDRFTGGFPTTPVPNTNGSFVGLEYDWSGVAWSTTTYASSSYKGLALLSPVHFLTAQHYEHSTNATLGIRILTNTGDQWCPKFPS